MTNLRKYVTNNNFCKQNIYFFQNKQLSYIQEKIQKLKKKIRKKILILI